MPCHTVGIAGCLEAVTSKVTALHAVSVSVDLVVAADADVEPTAVTSR
jgi:hypothetical protein